MFYRIVRQLSVQGRIIGAFTLILSLMVLSIPLVESINLTLSSRLAQLANVDVQIDRQLSRASKQILSVGVNFQRYTSDLVRSPILALTNIMAANQFIKNAEALTTDKDELEGLSRIENGLQS